MTDASPEVDWVPLEFRKWISGTADLSGEAEFVFWRLTLLAYDTQSATINRSAARLARWCKVPDDRLALALDELQDAGKIRRSGNSGEILVPAAEKHLERAQTHLGNRQRGAAIARRTAELRKQGKSEDDIAAMIEAEFPARVSKPKRPAPEPATPAAPSTAIVLAPRNPEPDDIALAVQAWNAVADAHNLARVQKLTDSRRSKLRQRLKECGGIDGWNAALELVKASPFLLGAKSSGWRADFDFIMQEKSFTKLMEGGYADKAPPPDKSGSKLRAAFAQNLERT